ncbi:hypothetical protein [Actinomadura sp. NBRC 104412]|uniref:hypothetical protein n=1 Tax=Actinomadura sp. NBRC 104412 TaxID=3032203 RepID=UPI002554A534|nr:hypothetical protein [Actinomadura sp. NBRC 104412]
MVHDDDTGERPEFVVRAQRPAPPVPPELLPPQWIQEEIVRLAHDPGYGVERIHAYCRRKYKGFDISEDAITYILAQAGVGRQR